MRRLLVFIFIFAIFLVFMVFNLGNKSNVSLGFTVFEEIPIFLTAFLSFVLGLLFSLPFFLGRGRKKSSQDQLSNAPSGETKKRQWLKKKDTPQSQDEIKKQDSPYGID